MRKTEPKISARAAKRRSAHIPNVLRIWRSRQRRRLNDHCPLDKRSPKRSKSRGESQPESGEKRRCKVTSGAGPVTGQRAVVGHDLIPHTSAFGRTDEHTHHRRQSQKRPPGRAPNRDGRGGGRAPSLIRQCSLMTSISESTTSRGWGTRGHRKWRPRVARFPTRTRGLGDTDPDPSASLAAGAPPTLNCFAPGQGQPGGSEAPRRPPPFLAHQRKLRPRRASSGTGPVRDVNALYSNSGTQGGCRLSTTTTVAVRPARPKSPIASRYAPRMGDLRRSGPGRAGRGGPGRGRRGIFALMLVALVATACSSGTNTTGPSESVGDAASGTSTQVNVDGRQIYLTCSGTSPPGSPTAILVSGYHGSSDDWVQDDQLQLTPPAAGPAVLPALSSSLRVCAYDRPGTLRNVEGAPLTDRSTPVSQPRTTAEMAQELHDLLAAAQVPGPYLLVGHSLGGLVVDQYTRTYPTQVSGVVFVDALARRSPLSSARSGLCTATSCSTSHPSRSRIPRCVGPTQNGSTSTPASRS